MRTLKLGASELQVPVVAVGCMRIGEMNISDIRRFVDTALERGANFFDHADIYGGGSCETKFAETLKEMKIRREDVLIQTKCGIRSGSFDFSKEHILASVDGSLKRLETDYVDALLLHRPDTLMEPEEVAEAFEKLFASGKVRHFGVSNQNPGHMRLLKKFVKRPLVINQLQFSPVNTGMIDSGLNVNMENPPSVDRDGGILEYCRLENVTIQPWSPFQYGFFEGPYIGSKKFPELNKKLYELAEKYGASPEAIVVAWILKHPARMQPVVGTTNPKRLRGIAKASEITLSREEWYSIYISAGNVLP